MFKIAICGASGVGKTSLANALSDRWHVPCLPEQLIEVVAAMNAVARAKKTNNQEEFDQAISNYLKVCQLWLESRRGLMEKHTEGFVADRWGMDILTRLLFSGICRNDDRLYRSILRQIRAEARQHLDAVVILPLADSAGTEAVNGDGLRRRRQLSAQLHSQALIYGLTAQFVRVPLLCIPPKAMTIEERAIRVENDLVKLLK